MPAYTTHDIRNIALVGQSGAGKTTLAEALLYHSGTINTQGSVDQGTTVTDFDQQEKRYQHSLDAAIASLTHDGAHINLLDTPGLNDFYGRAFAILKAAETTAVVINAESGIEPATLQMMQHAEEDERSRILIINKIDTGNTDLETLTEQLKETFGNVCLPLNLPRADGQGVVDCFFSPEGDATAFSSVEETHTTIIDQVVEVDEELMEIYLEQGQELSPEQLHEPFEKALREGHLIPICFVSAKEGWGMKQLLTIFSRLMPDPTEGNPPHFLKGEDGQAKPVEVSADPEGHVVAHVFKVSNDPYRGKLSYIRVYQGTITPNMQLYIGDARKPFKVNHLLRIQGSEQVEIERAVSGDICAVSRVEEIFPDAVIHNSHEEDNFHLAPESFPMPLFGLALTPQKRGDEQKLSEALNKLTAEDPCLTVEHDSRSNETVIRGLGELQMRVILEQLEERYNVHVDTSTPSIPYLETISGAAEGHHRHKKQTGGAGQFGEVFLKIAPLPRGEGFKFVDGIKGGVIPGQFIPAVEKGVVQAMEEGFIAGFPLKDIQVTVYDGKFHAVDSKEIAFVTAGKRAFQTAVENARPVVLEPIVNLSVSVQGEAMGDITADLSTRRGRVNNTEADAMGHMVITAQVPLSELDDYSTRLKAMTGGEGSYEIELSHYDPVPGNIQQELASKFVREVQTDD